MTVKEYNLEKDIYHLLRDEPFFAVLSRQLDKRPTESIPTAGIKFNADRLQYELLYNPTFFAELPDHHKKWVLMHELYHASFGHTQNRTLEAHSRKVANHSMDLAINSLPNMTQNAPDFVLMPGRQPYQEIKLHGMASEWYANWIKNNPDKINENDDGDPQFDVARSFVKSC